LISRCLSFVRLWGCGISIANFRKAFWIRSIPYADKEGFCSNMSCMLSRSRCYEHVENSAILNPFVVILSWSLFSRTWHTQSCMKPPSRVTSSISTACLVGFFDLYGNRTENPNSFEITQRLSSRSPSSLFTIFLDVSQWLCRLYLLGHCCNVVSNVSL
jgi:hypothetical protein